MKTNITSYRNAAVLAALLAGAVQAAAAWNTIYLDDFSGSGSTTLNGLAPDVRPGSETWTLNNTTAFDSWKANGSVVAGGALSGQNSIQLAFSPAAGNIYQLKVTMDLSTSATAQWVGLGFSDALTNPDGTGGAYAYGSGISGYSWMLHTDASGNQVQAFGGAQIANYVGVNWGLNPVDMRIVLDTTGAAWKSDFFITSSATGPLEVTLGSFTYVSNPTIMAVGLTKVQDVGGFVDNFSLEVQAVPEPTTMALGLIGGLSLLVAAKRRR